MRLKIKLRQPSLTIIITTTRQLFTNQMIGKAKHRNQDTTPPAESIAYQNELSGVRRDLADLQDMLTGMVLTDLDGINPALALSTRVKLQRAGFSQKILLDFHQFHEDFFCHQFW